MKKITLLLMVFVLGCSVVFAQSIRPLKNASIPKTEFVKKTEFLGPKSYTGFVDTLLYPAYKATNFTAWILLKSSSYYCSYATGQYYDCPQAVTVSGFVFYGYSNTSPTVSITANLYAVGADSLPTGAALATKAFTIDSFASHAHRLITFPTAITRNAPFVITLTTAKTAVADAVILYASDPAANDGQGEWLTVTRENGGAWEKTKAFSEGAQDLDLIFFPVVSYDVPDPSFTISPTCLSNPNTTVNTTLTIPPLYKDRMYDYYATSDSIKYQFGWNFGVTTDTVTATDTSYVYATPGAYTITLRYGYEGWYYYLNTALLTHTIDLCTEINENTTSNISIYPNPAKNIINIENASNAFIEVYSLNGSLVKQQQLNTDFEKVDLGTLSNGNYILKLNNGNSSLTKKIVVEK